jgi:3-oxoacyl-[acyl-carrier-protein] synthase-1
MASGKQPALSIADYSVSCALGVTRAEVAERLFAGSTGLVAPPFALPFTTLCGLVPRELAPLPAAQARFETRQARLAYATLEPLRPALETCLARYGRQRVAVVLGSSNAGLDTTERAFVEHARGGKAPPASALHDQHAYSAVLALIEALTGVAGPMLFVSTACSSSGKAFASAARLLRAGLADAVLVGGVDALCEMTVRGFRSLGVLAEDGCRPFSSARSGISIGEGAAFFLLERDSDRARGSSRASHAALQLLGCGEGADAHHMTAPHPQGEGAERVMRAALAQAGLDASQIDLVNAHGTATDQGDSSEAFAIARVLGTAPVVSTKGYTGHALGAAGAIEAALCLLTLEHGVAPASLGSAPVDEALPIQVLQASTRGAYKYVLSNSFAFGGSNVSLVLGRRA